MWRQLTANSDLEISWGQAAEQRWKFPELDVLISGDLMSHQDYEKASALLWLQFMPRKPALRLATEDSMWGT